MFWEPRFWLHVLAYGSTVLTPWVREVCPNGVDLAPVVSWGPLSPSTVWHHGPPGPHPAWFCPSVSTAWPSSLAFSRRTALNLELCSPPPPHSLIQDEHTPSIRFDIFFSLRRKESETDRAPTYQGLMLCLPAMAGMGLGQRCELEVPPRSPMWGH